MNAERLRQIEQLFHAALERAESRRADFLQEVCSGDEALRHEVETLLAYGKRAEGFIELSAMELAARARARDEVQAHPSLPANIGQDNVGNRPDDGVSLRPVAGFEPGMVIRKKYEVLGEIARGGMGVVYKARHLLWNEEKAIKLLLDMGDIGKQQTQRAFLAEALVMRQFQHPNIVRVDDADFSEDDKPFVVMEYIDGESLRQRMDRAAPMPWEIALEIISQACSGLAAAHQKGIIHRDIKPQNLLLAKGGDGREVLKLIDFGIAKVREDAGLGFTGIIASQTGLFVGTVEYASPEQAMAMRGRELDGRTDLYSLGLVLFEMLTGSKPFVADSPMALLLLRLLKDPVPPRELRPDLEIPQIVSELVMKALAREPEARWGSALEMQIAIGAVLDQRRADPTKAAGSFGKQERTAEEQVERKDAERERAETATAAAHRTEEERLQERLEKERQGREKVGAAHNEEEQVGRELPERQRWGVIGGAAAAIGVVVLGVWLLWPDPAPSVNPKDGLTYVWVPPGTFLMGCSAGDTQCNSDERPTHQVTISKGFWMGQTEVTQAAYERVMGKNPSQFKGGSLPVETVDWTEAQAYCQAVGMRLPTEAEWEYAARGGSPSSRYGNLDEIAWHSRNSGAKTHAVGQKRSNAFGLFDMLGNVEEWAADCYGAYRAGAQKDPHGPTSERYAVVRGAACRLSTRRRRSWQSRSTVNKRE